MEPTLDEALNALFGVQQPQAAHTAQTTSAAAKATSSQLDTDQAERFDHALEGDAAGRLGKIRKVMEALKHLLANSAI